MTTAHLSLIHIALCHERSRSLEQLYRDAVNGAEIPSFLDDRACDLPAAWRWLQGLGAERLSALNGLSPVENKRL